VLKNTSSKNKNPQSKTFVSDIIIPIDF
jgi:hypothetical protein